MDENQTLSPEAEAEELAEQARIRREKLAKLAAEGNDPYRKTKYDVTARSDEIKGARSTPSSSLAAPSTPSMKTTGRS